MTNSQNSGRSGKRKQAPEVASQVKNDTNKRPKLEGERPEKVKIEEKHHGLGHLPQRTNPKLEALKQRVEFTGLTYRDTYHTHKRTRAIGKLALDAYIDLEGDTSQLISLVEAVALHCEPCDLDDFTQNLDSLGFYHGLYLRDFGRMEGKPKQTAEVVPKIEHVPKIVEPVRHVTGEALEVDYPPEVIFSGKRKPDRKSRRSKGPQKKNAPIDLWEKYRERP